MHELGCDCTHRSPATKLAAKRPEGAGGFLYCAGTRGDDDLGTPIVTGGSGRGPGSWRRRTPFSASGRSNVPSLGELRRGGGNWQNPDRDGAGSERARPPFKRGSYSERRWCSRPAQSPGRRPIQALRCAIASVNVGADFRIHGEFENWMWDDQENSIRRAGAFEDSGVDAVLSAEQGTVTGFLGALR